MKLANITSVYRSKLIAKYFKGWLKGGQKVLDIGCGTGIVLYELNKTFGFKKAVGCDIQNYVLSDIDFKKMTSIQKLPFGNNTFNISMLNDVLHHTKYENQEKLIREAVRVSKYVLIFELKPTLIGKIGDYVLNKIHNPLMDIPFTYRSSDNWEETFNKNNYKYEKRIVKSPLWYPFSHIAYKITAK